MPSRLMAGRLALDRDPGAQHMPAGSASATPWYGVAARVGTGGRLHADVAQQVERLLQQDVTASSPVVRSM
jgi:hypothetical protein